MDEDPAGEIKHVVEDMRYDHNKNPKPSNNHKKTKNQIRRKKNNNDNKSFKECANSSDVNLKGKFAPEVFKRMRLRERTKNTFQMIANYKNRNANP